MSYEKSGIVRYLDHQACYCIHFSSSSDYQNGIRILLSVANCTQFAIFKYFDLEKLIQQRISLLIFEISKCDFLKS